MPRVRSSRAAGDITRSRPSDAAPAGSLTKAAGSGSGASAAAWSLLMLPAVLEGGVDGGGQDDGAADDVAGRWQAGMLAAGQAQVGLESGGADGGDGERLPGERADVLPGFQDGAGQAGAGPGLGGVGEDAVGDERFGRQPGRPGPALLAVVRRGFLIGVGGRVELAAGGGGEGVRVGVDLDATPRAVIRAGPPAGSPRAWSWRYCSASNAIAVSWRPPASTTLAAATESLIRWQSESRPPRVAV